MRTCEQPGEPLSLLQGPCLARPPPTLRPGPSAAPCAVKPHPSLSGRTWRQIFGGGGRATCFHLCAVVTVSII